MRLACVALLLAACHPFGQDDGHVTVVQPDMAERDPSLPDPGLNCSSFGKDPPLGTHGVLAFYLGWPDLRVTAPFAAGGKDQIVTRALGADQRIARVEASDPSILSLTLDRQFAACGFGVLELAALQVGHASILAFDKNDQLIDAFPLDVADTQRVALEPEVPDTTLYVGASGQALQAHAVTELADGTVLHGLGAVSYVGSGAVYDVTSMTTEQPSGSLSDVLLSSGDWVQFRVAPGDGQLTLSAPGTARGLDIHGTLGDEIDGLSINLSAIVESTQHPGQWSTHLGVHAKKGGRQVSAMRCDLLDLDTTGFLSELQTPTLGRDAVIDLELLAQPGDYTISCAIGSQVATLPLHIP